MKTKQIAKQEWPKFFDSFSRQHAGWLATLEIFATELGAQVEEHDLAFEGIVDERNETSGNQIIILMGAKRDDHITHTIADPADVNLEQTDEGADVALGITSKSGTTTLLRFRSPMLPAMVDDVVGPRIRPSV